MRLEGAGHFRRAARVNFRVDPAAGGIHNMPARTRGFHDRDRLFGTIPRQVPSRWLHWRSEYGVRTCRWYPARWRRRGDPFCQAISHPIRSDAAKSGLGLTDIQRLMPPEILWSTARVCLHRDRCSRQRHTVQARERRRWPAREFRRTLSHRASTRYRPTNLSLGSALAGYRLGARALAAAPVRRLRVFIGAAFASARDWYFLGVWWCEGDIATGYRDHRMTIPAGNRNSQ